MKKTLFLLLALTAGMVLQAQQTFTAVNADGVTITYKTTSDSTVEVARADGYTGAIAVPSTVSYESVSYAVTAVGARAFYNSAATYVSLPESVTGLGFMSLNTASLDSVRFACQEVPASNYSLAEIFGSSNLWRVKVVVPCGRLDSWKRAGWDALAYICTDCSYRLAVEANIDSIVTVWNSGIYQGAMASMTDRYYEEGDTAHLAVFRFSWTENNATRTRYGYFLGWGDGYNDRSREVVMPAHDVTLEYIVDTMPRATLAASRITTPVYLFGTMSYDGDVAGYRFRDIHYPYGEGADQVESWPSTIFNSSLWVASEEGSAVSYFFQDGNDFYPGPVRLDGTTDMETARRFSRVWHLTREQIDYHIAHCGEAGYTIPDDIMTWPGNGPEGYADQLAPYYDADSNGRYDARAGDYPIIRGDECVFSIFNDATGVHFQSQGAPLGLEVHSMTYAFNEPENMALWNTVFQHYDIYNRSAADLTNTYLGMWTDFDIGYAWDDFVGCDVRRGMFYAYNGMPTDTPGMGSFQGTTPAQGCVILGGARQPADGLDNPRVDIEKILSDSYTNPQVKQLLEQYRRDDGTLDTVAVNLDAELFFSYDPSCWMFMPGNDAVNQAINGANFGNGIADDERLGLTNFTYYENSLSAINGEPEYSTDFYNYMRSYWKNGLHIKYFGNGMSAGVEDLDARFMFPYDSDPWQWGTDGVMPQQPNAWEESLVGNMPGDRRGVGASGPFTFTAGSHQELDVAFVAGFSSDNWGAVRMLQASSYDVTRQWQHDTTDGGRPFVYMPYSAPREVGIEGVDEAALRVSPNPTTGRLTVSVPVETDVEVFDMMGRRLMAVHARPGAVALDLSALPQGIYLLRAAGAVSRIVKQ